MESERVNRASGSARRYQSFKLSFLPSLLTIAVVAPALMGSMNYLTHRSTQATFLVASLQQARPCAFCHDGADQLIPLGSKDDREELRAARFSCFERSASVKKRAEVGRARN